MAFKIYPGQCSCGNICNRLEKSGACPCLIQIQQVIVRYWRCCLLAGWPNFAVSRGKFNPIQCPFNKARVDNVSCLFVWLAFNLSIMQYRDVKLCYVLVKYNVAFFQLFVFMVTFIFSRSFRNNTHAYKHNVVILPHVHTHTRARARAHTLHAMEPSLRWINVIRI